MKTLKTLVSILVLSVSGMAIGQTSQAHFSSQNEIWKQVENQHVSEFTVVANSAALAQIQEKYSNLGSDVQFMVKNSTGNNHTIEMKFSSNVHKSYLYKMLLYIGCETVKIGSNTMSLDNFQATLND